MKTVTIKQTLNNNYVACVLPITGQQSSKNYVYVFNSEGKFIEKINNCHPLFTWVRLCKIISTIYCRYEVDELEEVINLIIENRFVGYTTINNLRNGKFSALLPPLNTVCY